MAAKKIWATGDAVLATDLNNNFRFGGTGADGALSISSGTTTINASSTSYVEKNYTSIAITGSANLAFSNPNNTTGTEVALRSQGAVTITTSSTHAVDMRSMGGGMGTSFMFYQVAGASATNGQGGAGGSSSGGQGGMSEGDLSAIGSGGNAVYSLHMAGGIVPAPNPMQRRAYAGGNGGSGAAGGSGGFSGGGGGGGGLGAGGLYIECGGAYNFTTGALDASGSAGSSGGAGTGGGRGGAGGGGGGGNILVMYNTLTANTGTYTVSGGAGGTTSGGNSGNAGAAGSALQLANVHFC